MLLFPPVGWLVTCGYRWNQLDRAQQARPQVAEHRHLACVPGQRQSHVAAQ
jgi:hypothetical protein